MIVFHKKKKKKKNLEQLQGQRLLDEILLGQKRINEHEMFVKHNIFAADLE